jgi:hypothetical protein
MSRRVSDLLVETLQAAGVKTCYGIVGDTLNRIAHAIDRVVIRDGRTPRRLSASRKLIAFRYPLLTDACEELVVNGHVSR